MANLQTTSPHFSNEESNQNDGGQGMAPLEASMVCVSVVEEGSQIAFASNDEDSTPEIVDIKNHNPSHLRNLPNVRGISVSSRDLLVSGIKTLAMYCLGKNLRNQSRIEKSQISPPTFPFI